MILIKPIIVDCATYYSQVESFNHLFVSWGFTYAIWYGVFRRIGRDVTIPHFIIILLKFQECFSRGKYQLLGSFQFGM